MDFRNYKISGACNPQFTYQALQKEDKVGTMLPCNVIVQEKYGQTEVAAIDPVASMQSIENPALGTLAKEVQSAMKRIIGKL